MYKKNKDKGKVSNVKEFLNVIKYAYFGKGNNETDYTDKTFSILSSLLFYVMGVGMLMLLFGLAIGIPIYYINTFDWKNILEGILGIVFCVSIIVILFILATLMMGAAREQQKGKDSIVVFSAIVSFVALIVAFIALFK